MTTTNRYRKKADGTVSKKRRIRYACYKKVRKLTDCDGQSGYSAEKLDRVVETVIKNVFNRMRGITKEEVLSARYEKQLAMRKCALVKAQTELAREQEKLMKLREEVIRSIQGESVYSKEMLAGLVSEVDGKVRELEIRCEQMERELEERQALLQELSDSYDEILFWSALYDSATMEQKKMIVNAMIRRVDVFSGYRLDIEFSVHLRQFFEGIGEEENQAKTALIKTA